MRGEAKQSANDIQYLMVKESHPTDYQHVRARPLDGRHMADIARMHMVVRNKNSGPSTPGCYNVLPEPHTGIQNVTALSHFQRPE
jgi:hypothetical protein